MNQNKLRWRKQVDQVKNNTKDFQILNFQECLQTQVVLILIHGPPGSPYEGCSFRLQYNGLEIPYLPPKLRFIDIPWNPFVCPKTGSICCDILKQNWSPVFMLRTTVLAIISLLDQTKMPQGQSGLNIEAAAEMNIKYSQFWQKAKQKSEKSSYIKQNHHYKDEQKPVSFIPADVAKNDLEYMEQKSKFIENPEICKTYRQKISQISKV